MAAPLPGGRVRADSHAPAPPAMRDEPLGTDPATPDERVDGPRQLFLVWFAAGLTFLSVPTGAVLSGVWGLSLWQALLATAAGVAIGAVIVGLIALPGARTGLNTLTLSRAAFGRWGNVVPTVVSLVVLVGWTSVGLIVTVEGLASALLRLGIAESALLDMVVLAAIGLPVVAIGVLGIATLVRAQTALAYSLIVLSIMFFVLRARDLDWGVVTAAPPASMEAVIAGFVVWLVFMGSGWWNASSDYSRFQRLDTSPRAVFAVTAVGVCSVLIAGTLGVILGYGTPGLGSSANPMVLLTNGVPSWFLVPYMVVVGGSVAAALIPNFYSAVQNMRVLGAHGRRWPGLVVGAVAVGVSAAVLLASTQVLGLYGAFLTVLGVPIAAWTGVMLSEMAVRRRRGWDVAMISSDRGMPAVDWAGCASFAVGCLVGFGLTSSGEGFLGWLGFLGGSGSSAAQAQVGVPLALVTGALVHAALRAIPKVRAHTGGVADGA